MIVSAIERDKVQKLCSELVKDNGEALNFPRVKNVFLKEPKSIIGYISNPIQDTTIRSLLKHDDIPIYHCFEDSPLKEKLNIVSNCMVVGTAGSGKSTLLRALYNGASIVSPLVDDIMNQEQRDLLSEVHGEYSSKVSVDTRGGGDQKGMARTIRATGQTLPDDDKRLNAFSVIPVDSSGRDWVLIADTPGVLDGEKDASARFGNWDEGRKAQVDNLRESGLPDQDKIPIHTFQNLNEKLSREMILKCDSFHKIGISDALNQAESGRNPLSFDTILVVGSMLTPNSSIPFELMSLLNTTTSHIGKDTKFVLVLTRSNSTRISDYDNLQSSSQGSHFAHIGNTARSYLNFFTQVYQSMGYNTEEAKDLARNIKVFYVEFDNKYSYFTQVVAIRKELASKNHKRSFSKFPSTDEDKSKPVPMEELLPWIKEAASKLADDKDWCYQQLACTGHFTEIFSKAKEAIESANKRGNSVETFMDNFDSTLNGMTVLSTIIKNNMSYYESKHDHIGNLYLLQELSPRDQSESSGHMLGVLILKRYDFKGLHEQYVEGGLLQLPGIWTSSSVGSQSNLWIADTSNIVIARTTWVEGKKKLRLQLPNMYYLDESKDNGPKFTPCERTSVLNNNVEVQINYIPNAKVSDMCSEIEVTLQNYEERDVKEVATVLRGLNKLGTSIKSLEAKTRDLPITINKIKDSAVQTKNAFNWSIQESSKSQNSEHSKTWNKGLRESESVFDNSNRCLSIIEDLKTELKDMLSLSASDNSGNLTSGAETGSIYDIIVDASRALQQLNSVFDASQEMKNDVEHATGNDENVINNPHLPETSVSGRCLYRASIRSSWISVIRGRICDVYSSAFNTLLEHLDNVKTNFISAKDQLMQCFTMLKYALKMYENNKVVFESCYCESMNVEKLKVLVNLLGMGANQSDNVVGSNTTRYYQKVANLIDIPENANSDDLDGTYDLKPSVAAWFTDITESGIKKQKEYMMHEKFSDSWEQITTIQKDQISHFYYSIHLRDHDDHSSGVLIQKVNGSLGYYSSDDFTHQSVAVQTYPISNPVIATSDRPNIDANATLFKIHHLVDKLRSILLESLQKFTTMIQQHQKDISAKMVALKHFHSSVSNFAREKFPTEDNFNFWNKNCFTNIQKVEADCKILEQLQRTGEDIFYKTKMNLGVGTPFF